MMGVKNSKQSTKPRNTNYLKRFGLYFVQKFITLVLESNGYHHTTNKSEDEAV